MQYSTFKKIVLYLSLGLILTSYLTCTASQEALKEEQDDSKDFTFYVPSFPKEILITHILSNQDIKTLLAVRGSSKLLKECAEDLSIWKQKIYTYLQSFSLDASLLKNVLKCFCIDKLKISNIFIKYLIDVESNLEYQYFWINLYDSLDRYLDRKYGPSWLLHTIDNLPSNNFEDSLKQINLIQVLELQNDFLLKFAGIYKVINVWEKSKNHCFSNQVSSQEQSQYFKSLLNTTFLGTLNTFLTEHNLIPELLLLIRYNPFIEKYSFSGCKIVTINMESIISALQTVMHLQFLSFSQTNINDEVINHLSKFIENHKTLKLLDLSHNNITDKGALVLAKSLKKNTTLTELNMGNNDIYQQGVAALKKISNEKSFKLKWKSLILLSPADLESLTESSLVHSGDIEIERWLKNPVETLSLSNKFISTLGIKNLLIVLSKFSQLHNLQLNHVNSCSGDIAHSIIKKIVKNSYLTSLSLDGFRNFTTLLKALSQEKNLPSLECLNLINNNINNNMIYIIRCVKSHPYLRKLSLIRSNIINKDMWLLGKLFKNNSSLLALNLSENKLNMHSVNDLLVHAYCLKELILNNNRLEHFPIFLTQLSQLEVLHLDNTNLNYLPREISRLVQLKDLSVRHNTLKRLPEELYQLTKLLSLTLNTINILELNKLVRNFLKLKTLQLDYMNLDFQEMQIFEELKKNNPNLVVKVDSCIEEVD